MGDILRGSAQEPGGSSTGVVKGGPTAVQTRVETRSRTPPSLPSPTPSSPLPTRSRTPSSFPSPTPLSPLTRSRTPSSFPSPALPSPLLIRLRTSSTPAVTALGSEPVDEPMGDDGNDGSTDDEVMAHEPTAPSSPLTGMPAEPVNDPTAIISEVLTELAGTSTVTVEVSAKPAGTPAIATEVLPESVGAPVTVTSTGTPASAAGAPVEPVTAEAGSPSGSPSQSIARPEPATVEHPELAPVSIASLPPVQQMALELFLDALKDITQSSDPSDVPGLVRMATRILNRLSLAGYDVSSLQSVFVQATSSFEQAENLLRKTDAEIAELHKEHYCDPVARSIELAQNDLSRQESLLKSAQESSPLLTVKIANLENEGKELRARLDAIEAELISARAESTSFAQALTDAPLMIQSLQTRLAGLSVELEGANKAHSEILSDRQRAAEARADMSRVHAQDFKKLLGTLMERILP